MVSTENTESEEDKLVERWIQGFRRGSLRFFILHLLLHRNYHEESKLPKQLHKRAFHGYNIAKAIDKVTQGRWHPTTASIYPILKQFKDEGIIEEVEPKAEEKEDSKDFHGKRIIRRYRLTPYGVKVAKKVEQARKDFSKSFIPRRKGPPPVSLLKLESKITDKEFLTLLSELDIDVLETERDHLKKRIPKIQETLEILEGEIATRKKAK
ncbi:MAG: PadR family transcriptional regulator [Candidatus Hodarchaeota archaeon]